MDRTCQTCRNRYSPQAYYCLRYREPDLPFLNEHFRCVYWEEGMSRSPSKSATRTRYREGTRRGT